MPAVEGKPAASFRALLGDLWSLGKPRITLLVAITVAAGYALATPAPLPLDWGRLLETVVGVALVSAGAAAFNQVWEREVDRKMARTAQRPIPAGRLSVKAGVATGAVLATVGAAGLAWRIDPLVALLALATLAGYVFVYTPLKLRTPLVTLIGAVPGAMPPLIGWVAASGRLELGGWILFALLYLWQLPHVLAIAWLHRDDYRAAGIRLLPLVEDHPRMTRHQAVVSTLAVLPVSFWPAAVGLAGAPYLVLAGLAGLGFLGASLRFARRPERRTARGLVLASVFYVPVVLGSWVVDVRWVDRAAQGPALRPAPPDASEPGRRGGVP